jgi:DNA repair protein RecO (recombination protein O)
MERNSTCKGIVLRNYRIGEIHKGVVLLTDRFGLLSAIAHGAYAQKGKLRSVTNPFCNGTFYLYHNPQKNSTKITDVSIDCFYQNLRDSLSKFYAASLWAEIVVKSFGGGDEGSPLYELLSRALEAADRADPRDVSRVSAQFIWRYLGIVGVRPALSECAVTGQGLQVAEEATYSRVHGGFVAEGYTQMEDMSLSPGARRYLEHTAQLPFSRAVDIKLDAGALASLRAVLLVMVQDAVESPLNTLKIGEGFL